jgi:hypothetical protein
MLHLRFDLDEAKRRAKVAKAQCSLVELIYGSARINTQSGADFSTRVCFGRSRFRSLI